MEGPPKYTTKISLKDKIFFLRILCRWRGSVWQMLWLDLLVFISFYILFNAIYHFVLGSEGYEDYKRSFEHFVIYVQKIATNTPLSFLLGFFVSAVLGRWWQVCTTIPFLSRPAVLLHSYIHSKEHRDVARKVRFNILRYMNLAWIMAMKPLSMQIFKRFALPGEKESDFHKLKRSMDKIISTTLFLPMQEEPIDETLVEAHFQKINDDPHVKRTFGELITKEEIEVFSNIARHSGQKGYKGEYWIPVKWCSRILLKAREAKLIPDEVSYEKTISILDKFRTSLGSLGLFNDINIPLVYTQVIMVAVYSFFLAEIFSSQLMGQEGVREVRISNANTTVEEFKRFDNFVPIFSIFKFIFFMGWFKTAISLLNPLGSDAYDFPSSKVLDYNLKMSIACGGAGDEIFPDELCLEGDSLAQLSSLRDFPGSDAGSLAKSVEGPRVSTRRSLRGDTAENLRRRVGEGDEKSDD